MKLSLKLLALILSASLCLQASANTITVTNTADSGAGTLRAALDPVTGAQDGDTIDFNLTYPATITLTTGQLVVGNSVTISGPGANNLAVDGNHVTPVFLISEKTVTISGLTIKNGAVFFQLSGGGIRSFGSTLTVTNSTLSNDFASAFGGGIYNNFGALTVTNSTFSGNSAPAGGGVGGGGGGIANDEGTVTVTNSTFSGNSAGVGGGIYNSTGVFFFSSATLMIGDTILNAGTSGANISYDSEVAATTTSLGYNLSSDDASAVLNATGDQNSTDPKLDTNGLQDNGGPTLTIALQPDSPAINMGDPSFTPPPDYDQRGPGYPRVVNGRIDIGAFEVQTPPVCPQPQGYWKNNPSAWPVSALPMTLGSQTTYTQTELLTILRTPTGKGTKADASLILADQLIAAKLNIANGADRTPVTSTIADADAVLSLYTDKLPYKVRTNTTNGHRMVNDAATLESFNKGMVTPGCGG